jgi:hypothetical protein
VVECLPRKCEALSSSPNTEKKKSVTERQVLYDSTFLKYLESSNS